MAYLWYAVAALAEIAGCFAMWMVVRQGKSIWWMVPCVLSLLVFAWLLTRIESSLAGRVYAAYGGVYILAAVCWQGLAEKHAPDRWDITGALICIAGSLLIIWGPRAS